MSELNTFIKATRFLKREGVVDPEGPIPDWYAKVSKMVMMGSHVHEVALEHRMPILEKGSVCAANAMTGLESDESMDEKKKRVALAYVHIALAVFRSCFYELFPDSDMTVLCYLMALSLVAQDGIPASDTLRASLFVHCVANAFRKTRTGSKQMSSEKIGSLSKTAMNAVAPRNPKAPTPAEIQKYCTLILTMSAASLFCRNFQMARESVKPLISELPQLIAEDDVDMAHQLIDSHIIYARCLTEDNKMDAALEVLKRLIGWLSKKVAVIAPRRIVAALNHWRPDLSSSNNGMLWSTVTAFQLKLVEANPNLFSIEELAQLFLLMAAHLCHTAAYDRAHETLTKARTLIEKLPARSTGSTIGGFQELAIRAWILEGLAKKAKSPAEKKKRFKECWDVLSSALHHPGSTDEASQVTLMAKMSWVGAQITDDPNVAATIKAFNADEDIKNLVQDPQLAKWAQFLPSELIVPYWALIF